MRSAVRTSLALVLCAALSPSVGDAAKVKLARSWADPGSGSRRYEKLVVVGIAATPALRAEYEQAFVDEFKLRSVASTRSYDLVNEGQLDRSATNERLRKDGVAALIVVRLVDPATFESNYTSVSSAAGPPITYHGGWHGYFTGGVRNASSSGFAAANQQYRVETCMYDTRNDNLVWSGLSMLTVTRSDAPGSEMKPIVATLVSGLERDKLVPPLPKPEKKKPGVK